MAHGLDREMGIIAVPKLTVSSFTHSLKGGKGISLLVIMKPTLLTVANPGGSGILNYYYEELVEM